MSSSYNILLEKFTKWYNATCRGNIALKQNEVIYGVLKYTSSGLAVNLLIIIQIGRHFLYINAFQDERRSLFTDFLTLVNEKTELEKIYCDYNKYTTFFYNFTIKQLTIGG